MNIIRLLAQIEEKISSEIEFTNSVANWKPDVDPECQSKVDLHKWLEIGYQFRTLVSFAKEVELITEPDEKYLSVWVLLADRYSWRKANQFHWCLRLYGQNKWLENVLKQRIDENQHLEWIYRENMLTLGMTQKLSESEISIFFGHIKGTCYLKKLAVYELLINQIDSKHHLFQALYQHLKGGELLLEECFAFELEGRETPAHQSMSTHKYLVCYELEDKS